MAFVATGLFANAQGGAAKQGLPDAATRAAKNTERMTTALTLTDEQKPKVLKINTEKATAMDANQAKNGKDQKALDAERDKITAKWETDLKVVLTAEQMAKLKKMQAEQKAKMQGSNKPNEVQAK